MSAHLDRINEFVLFHAAACGAAMDTFDLRAEGFEVVVHCLVCSETCRFGVTTPDDVEELMAEVADINTFDESIRRVARRVIQ